MGFLRVWPCAVAALALLAAGCSDSTGARPAQPVPHAEPARQETAPASPPVSVIGPDGHADTDGPETIGPRQAAAPGTQQLVSTNGWSEMMLKNDAVWLQLTDQGMKKIGEAQGDRGNDDGILGGIIRDVALSAMTRLLDHSIALPLKDIRSASVRDGEVIVVTCDGKEVFDKVEFNGVAQTYPGDAAEAFVKKLMQARAALPECGV